MKKDNNMINIKNIENLRWDKEIFDETIRCIEKYIIPYFINIEYKLVESEINELNILSLSFYNEKLKIEVNVILSHRIYFANKEIDRWYLGCIIYRNVFTLDKYRKSDWGDDIDIDKYLIEKEKGKHQNDGGNTYFEVYGIRSQREKIEENVKKFVELMEKYFRRVLEGKEWIKGYPVWDK